MNVLSKLYSVISKFNNFIELKKNCGGVNVGKKTKFHQAVSFWCDGRINIGDKCEFDFNYGGRFAFGMCELQTRNKGAVINIGNNVLTNNNLKIIARGTVDIGDDCLIGENVTIMDHNAHGVKPSERRTSAGTVKDVSIGKNVWIGNNVTILPGSKIGDNSILAVGCVVKGNIPANVIVQGNPGVIVKNINC